MRNVIKLGCLIALALAAPVSAADYYVKNGGNDALDGLSLANAWATLQHAADTVGPGDTVHVQNGNYAGFYQSNSGAAGNPITFLAESPAVQITADNGTTPDGINIEGAAYVVVDGFTVNNRTRAGIRTALSQFVTIRNCRCGYNGRWGIFSGFADDLTIEDNETHHSVLEHGIYVSNSGDRPIIRRNVSYSNYAAGIHMNGDLSQGGDGQISDALVERNVIYDNGVGGGSAINMDGVSDSVVRNNLLYDNHASGISLFQIDGADGSQNNLVINNTIVNAANGRWCININTGSTGNTLRNNILYNYHPFRGVIVVDASSLSGFSSDYNSLMDRMSADGDSTIVNLATWQGLGYDANSYVATPADHFVAPGSDFHLLNTSPAINTATATGAPSEDLEGNPRPVDFAPDMGAYEYQLVNCGNGSADSGEECGEPGLACSGSQTCVNCQCVNPSLCSSGIPIENASLKMVADPMQVKTKGEALFPKPWAAIDPLANGMRLVIDSPQGSGGIDVTLPGGAYDGTSGWRTNAAATKWLYKDPAGSVGGITKAVLKDRSSKTDGLVRWVFKGRGGSITLPDVNEVRTTVVVGSAAECASMTWNPPGSLPPSCGGDAATLKCR